MTSRDFAFWLQGSFEISGSSELNERQVDIIKNHLALVFKHEIDPSMGGDKHQNELNDIHKPSKIETNNHIDKINNNTDAQGDLMRC
jgi:hypothetical protein